MILNCPSFFSVIIYSVICQKQTLMNQVTIKYAVIYAGAINLIYNNESLVFYITCYFIKTDNYFKHTEFSVRIEPTILTLVVHYTMFTRQL